MAVQALPCCVDHRAYLDLANLFSPRTTVREITAASAGIGGPGTWIRRLGAEPIELDTDETFRIDVTNELRARYFDPEAPGPQRHRVRIDIHSTPQQDIQGSLYQFTFGPDGSITTFEAG